MTHKTNLPNHSTRHPTPQTLIPASERLVALYLRTLTSPQTINL